MKLTPDQIEILAVAQRLDALRDFRFSPPPPFAAHQIVYNSERLRKESRESYEAARTIKARVREVCYQLIRRGLMERAGWGNYMLTATGRGLSVQEKQK